MNELKVWKLSIPPITLKDIFKAEGADYSERTPRPKTIELHERILREATQHIKPMAIWREVKITGTKGQELHLEDGQILTSPLLAQTAGSADHLVLTAITIGNTLDIRVDDYKKEGKVSEAFALDAAGTAYFTQTSTLAFIQIENHYREHGLRTTFPMGPGHSYWPRLEDLQMIFHSLKPEKYGLRLTNSNFILPRKSAAMVLGVGLNLPESHGKSHCNFCSLQATCPLSQV